MQPDPINQKEIKTNHNHDEFLESIRMQNHTNREQNYKIQGPRNNITATFQRIHEDEH